MKTLCLGLILSGVAMGAFGQATPDEHAAHHPQQTAPAQSAPSAPTAADLQQKTKAMQALMEKLENTRNAAERERLLAQHHQAMREQLESLKHMNCAMGMTGGDARGGEENRTMGQGMMAGGMMKCHEITQMRLDAMVGMMEQMMRHEAARHRGR